MESFNVSIISQLWGEKLDSTSFTWLNHASICGTSSMDILNMEDWKNNRNLVKRRFEIIGWCYASNLTVRPRLDAIAVMFWDSQAKQEVWCHISETLLIIFCIRLNIGKSAMFQTA